MEAVLGGVSKKDWRIWFSLIMQISLCEMVDVKAVRFRGVADVSRVSNHPADDVDWY